PATPAEALAAAKPGIELARKAKAAETPDVVKGIRRALDLMQPHAKKGADDTAFAAAWNETLSLARFHGIKSSADYVMDPQAAAGHVILFGIPRGRGWTFEPKNPGKDDQCWGKVMRAMSDGRIAAEIYI